MSCRPLLAVVAFGALLCGCSRGRPPVPRKLAILPLESLSLGSPCDWAGTAAQLLLRSMLEGGNAGTTMTARSVVEARAAAATHALQGTCAVYRDRIELSASIEDLRNGKFGETMKAGGQAAGGVLPLVDTLARGFSSAPRPLPTRSEQAAEHYAEAARETEPVRAAAALHAAVEADPGLAPAWWDWAQLLQRRGEAAGAKDVLARAAAHKQRFQEIDRRKLELLEAMLGNDPGARQRTLAAIVQADPSDHESLRALAQTQYLRRDYRAAEASYNRLLESEPANAELWNALGYTQALAGDLDAARTSLERYRKLAPQEVNPLDSLGEVHYMAGRFAEAERYFRDAAAMNIAFLGGAPLLKAAQCRLAQVDTAVAEELFGRYLEMLRRSGDPLIEIRRGQWMFLTGRRREAMELWEGLKKGPETAAAASLQLALANLELGRRTEARSEAAAAIRTARTPLVAGSAGMAVFLAAPSAPAADWLNRAEQGIRQPGALVLRKQMAGAALLLDGHAAEAMPQFAEAYALSDPAAADELRELAAWSCLDAGDAKAAAGFLNRQPVPWSSLDGLFRFALYPRQYYLRALLAEKQGRTEAARSGYKLFLKLAGDVPDAFGHLKHARDYTGG